jgi:hypothetical protein
VKPGKEEILDIDDTFCAAHGGQQLAFWNAYEDERGFSPMHIYHVSSGAPVVAILRSAKTPKGTEVRTVVKHVMRRIRKHWPKTHLIWRGDSHYGRHEVMEWAENNDTDYIFGLAGNNVLDARVAKTADYLRVQHAFSTEPRMRRYTSFEYQAGSWSRALRSRCRRIPMPKAACARLVSCAQVLHTLPKTRSNLARPW